MNKIASGLKTLFLVHLVLGVITALMLFFAPVWFGGLMGFGPDAKVPLRLVGAAILGFSYGSWWSYRASTWEQVRIVVLTELVWPTFGALVLLWGLLFNRMLPFGWVNFVILAGFAIAFYFYYSKQQGGSAPVVSAAAPASASAVKPAVKAPVKAAPRKAARPARKRRR